MKQIFLKGRTGLLLLFFMNFLANCKAQETELSKNYKDSVVTITKDLLADYYVFKESGIKAGKHLLSLHKNGHFKTCTDLETFAAELTKSIYAMTYDKHIQIRLKPKNQTDGDELSKWVDSRMGERNYFRLNNANFKTIRKLHGNVGYLELRGFYGLAWGKKVCGLQYGYVVYLRCDHH